MSYRAHELISNLKPDSQEFTDCIAAVKFDLGEIDNITSMFDISHQEFFRLPAPLCLFQVSQGIDIHFFLAQEKDSFVLWKRFGKQMNDGFRWTQEDLEIGIPFGNATQVMARKISTGQDSDVIERLNQWAVANGPDDSDVWTVRWCLLLAASIEVFSCSNVFLVDNPPPKFINAKRAEKGKVPFFSFKTLHIQTERREAKGAISTGTHASPRLHLRRGHIRRLPPDGVRRIWIVATLVGDKKKGLALHDYKVKGSSHERHA